MTRHTGQKTWATQTDVQETLSNSRDCDMLSSLVVSLAQHTGDMLSICCYYHSIHWVRLRDTTLDNAWFSCSPFKFIITGLVHHKVLIICSCDKHTHLIFTQPKTRLSNNPQLLFWHYKSKHNLHQSVWIFHPGLWMHRPFLYFSSALAFSMLHFICSGGIWVVPGTNFNWLLINVLTSLCGLDWATGPGWSKPLIRACARSDSSAKAYVHATWSLSRS